MRSTLLRTLLVALLAGSAPAAAHWLAGGSGTGTAPTATMPAGERPTASASGRSATVRWAQSDFNGSRLGDHGGTYVVSRHAEDETARTAPGGSCAEPAGGSAATLECVDDGVPYGRWRYTVKPVLRTFTGDPGPASDVVAVRPDAPTVDSAAAQNPPVGEETGAIELQWSAVADATGYNVYRRTAGGSYDLTAPLNGATPVTGRSHTDARVTAGTTYAYVVRAVAGSPGIESPSSDERTATPITRPAAPAGAVSATAAAGGRIDVSWTGVRGADGYNVYRRTAAGEFDFGRPLNGAGAVPSTSYADGAATDGTSYVYVVRAVVDGAKGTQVESSSSTPSAGVASDATAPPAPSATSLTSGGPVLAGATCGLASSTRFVNAAGRTSVGVSAAIATPETGQRVVFSASVSGTSPVTVGTPADGTSVSSTMDLGSLPDGAVTVTARTRDAAGNLSPAVGTGNAVVKDVVGGALSGVTYHDNALTNDTLSGASECGARITATKTAGSSTGKTFPASGTFTVGSGGAFSGFAVDAAALSSYGYDVVATDLAGNAGSTVRISGTAVL